MGLIRDIGGDVHSAELLSLALRSGQEGRHEEAVRLWRAVLESDGEQPQARHNLGVALLALGRTEEAVVQLRAAVRLDPAYAKAHLNLAKSLAEVKQYGEAEIHFRRVAELSPGDADAFVEWGRNLMDQRQPDRAAIILRQAVRLKPDNAAAHNWLGLAHLEAGELPTAESCFARGLELDPQDALIHQNFGTALKEQGRLAEALAAYDVALVYDPDNASIRWNRSLALLQAGDFARGWPEYEWRFRRGKTPRREFGKPQWDGRADLSGKTILIHAEQGLGDTLQFCRFARKIKDRGAGNVVMEVQSPIAALLASCDGVDHLVSEGEPLPEFDFHLPVMSGPAATQTTLANVPSSIPYLHVDPNRVKHWAAVIHEQAAPRPGREMRLKVGIAWQGNPHHKLDRFRSMRLEEFAPLASDPRLQLFSLQRGPGTEQLDTALGRSLGIVELTNRCVTTGSDWIDAAALMENLDLVVSVDTAVAHLAGALARPVWVALSAVPDWRWMLNRNDSPWYPTARLFRQERLGEWQTVVSAMVNNLLVRS